jgi:hypothetical protein
MKKNTQWLLILVPVLIMILAMIIIDRKPENFIFPAELQKETNTISIKKSVVDSLFRTFSTRKTIQILFDSSHTSSCKVTLKNLIGPEEILNKDWMNSNIMNAKIANEGFNVVANGQRPYDVILEMKWEKGFVTIPTGVMFKLLYP